MTRKHTILIKLILKLSKCIIRSGCSSSLVFTRRQFRKPLIRDSFRKQESLTSLVGDSEKENNILGDNTNPTSIIKTLAPEAYLESCQIWSFFAKIVNDFNPLCFLKTKKLHDRYLKRF